MAEWSTYNGTVLTYGGNMLSPVGKESIGGREYRTVMLPDGKIWMAENLDLEFSLGDTRYNYYDNNQAANGWNGLRLGLLYSGDVVREMVPNMSSIAPGWRFPTVDDVLALGTALGGTWDQLPPDWPPWSPGGSNRFSRCPDVGNALRSKTVWDIPGDDTYLFNAKGAGYYEPPPFINPRWYGKRLTTKFWTSTYFDNLPYSLGYFGLPGYTDRYDSVGMIVIGEASGTVYNDTAYFWSWPYLSIRLVRDLV